ncbi:MAG TPA: hypothetical protein EYN00_02890, partial [Planctomycetes bacterium]|nr:hypothetical protein [Planctomycetota bacterium]
MKSYLWMVIATLLTATGCSMTGSTVGGEPLTLARFLAGDLRPGGAPAVRWHGGGGYTTLERDPAGKHQLTLH